MIICVCGGGALGTVCAGVFSSMEGMVVNLYTQHPQKWNRTVCVADLNNNIFQGDLNLISDDPEKVIKGCDIVLLCLPGYLIEETLVKIKPYLERETIIGSIVSSTGFFFMAHDILSVKTKLFGFQRVPFISRVGKYGREASLLGYKNVLNVAIENVEEVVMFKKLLESLFLTPVNILNNYYEASLTNSNPILHTGRLYSMWHYWNGEAYSNCSYFYKDWDDESSKLILAMDDEFLELLSKLPIEKGRIPSLLDYYEVTDKSSLTKKISSIEAFKGILSPMIRIEAGWIPDFRSRYFIEDFPFGLRFIKDLAVQCKISTPVIDEVYNWGLSVIKR